MARSDTTTLSVEARQAEGSRATRRLRRTGRVPGVVYGGGDEPQAFHVDARDLRLALAAGGAVIELSVGAGEGQPVILKDQQRGAVRGETLHIDLLRVRLDQAIHATVFVELDGVEEAPGVKEGGVLEQVTREVNIEALPNEIPDSIHLDVSGAEMGDTITLAALPAPPGVTLLDDPEETVLATVTVPTAPEEEEIETETELVGEGEEGAEGAEGEGAPEDAGDADGGAPDTTSE
ncbi:MAG TPA: 50S ribosomal protein L25 [Solirubrobacteraceae bacterium]|nr:50S ribosomal protein L25 [Solirubrobacteraceae bacterium]